MVSVTTPFKLGRSDYERRRYSEIALPDTSRVFPLRLPGYLMLAFFPKGATIYK